MLKQADYIAHDVSSMTINGKLILSLMVRQRGVSDDIPLEEMVLNDIKVIEHIWPSYICIELTDGTVFDCIEDAYPKLLDLYPALNSKEDTDIVNDNGLLEYWLEFNDYDGA